MRSGWRSPPVRGIAAQSQLWSDGGRRNPREENRYEATCLSHHSVHPASFRVWVFGISPRISHPSRSGRKVEEWLPGGNYCLFACCCPLVLLLRLESQIAKLAGLWRQ